MTDSEKTGNAAAKSSTGMWMVYISMVLGGLLLLGETFEFAQLQKWTAKGGIALLFSAISLIIGNGRKTGFLAATIIWAVVVGLFAYDLFGR